ncbi:MAG: hypothetical protein QN193_06580 [Armatimonadota bacterium]|nr:hypothetical protein [Armatimonadota bacterium]MDR7440252.1 hypothetical protein [Armatimonadota bacterium]MDR7444579.1 hypothetical protein [Armatimonadota bacterium]MDR7570255.1 hypothetical protein [Armatimonadota bacterium]MDR7615368.1 hypothetical protein [Armatimonadota bacterium]
MAGKGAGITIRLTGPAVAQGRIPVDDLVLLARQVQAAVERIALVLRGESGMKPGRRPAEVERLTRLEVVGLGRGSVVLQLDLARDQQALEGLDLGEEATKAWVEGLDTLQAKGLVPPGWDTGALLAWRETAALYRRGVESIEVVASLTNYRRSTRVGPDLGDRIVRLISRPSTNSRVVEGRLLMADFKETAARCRIHPPMGPPVECTFDEGHRQAVLDALTKHVRVTGEAEIDPETSRIKRLSLADIEILDSSDGGASRSHSGSPCRWTSWLRFRASRLSRVWRACAPTSGRTISPSMTSCR